MTSEDDHGKYLRMYDVYQCCYQGVEWCRNVAERRSGSQILLTTGETLTDSLTLQRSGKSAQAAAMSTMTHSCEVQKF